MRDAAVVRVVFLFPDSSEIRYLNRAPRLGRSVRSEHGRSCVVSEVFPSGVETYTAVCVAREHLVDVGSLASDLLQRARDSGTPKGLLERWRRRNYIP